MATAFISYSHRDETYRQELETHLAPLKRQGLLSLWTDRRLLAGDPVDDAISESLERADLILMLISADFVASNYCYAREMKRALERHEAKVARAISIVCRPCDFHELPFARFVLLPTDARPVSLWPDRDAAWVDVVSGIRAVLRSGAVPPRPASTAEPRLTKPVEVETHMTKRSPLPTKVTDLQLDTFARNAMRDIGNYFEKELDMMAMRDVAWKGEYQAIDARKFGGQAYFQGKEVASCTIFQGSPLGARSIHYSQGLNYGGNSWNEALTVETDTGGPYLKPMNMPSHFAAQRPTRMEPFDAARYLFELFMDQARSRIR